MADSSLLPDWESDPADRPPAAPPSESLYARSGISNLSGPARFTIVCLALNVVFRIVGLFGTVVMTHGAQGPGTWISEGATLSGMAGLVTGSLGILLTICLIFGFLVWLLAAAGNARVISGRELRISPGWQVAWYFIPFFNLVMPFLGMQEVVARSKVANPDHAFLLTTLWWLTWILATFGIYIARLSENPTALPFLSYETVLTVTSAVLMTCAAIFLILLIHLVTKSQVTFARSWLSEEESPA